MHPALLALHRDLPQQGPGSDAATARALSCVPPLGPEARILDVGCGPGRQTLVLARETPAAIEAVDVAPEFLATLRARAERAGLAARIRTHVMDMGALDFPDGRFALVWSEGAIYHLGFERGLRAWRRLLAPGGHLAATELSWLGAARPPEAEAFWAEAYPGMAGVEENAAAAGRAGYAVVETFALPETAWWEGYYTPLRERLAALRERLAALGERHAGDAAVLAALAATAREIDLFERHADAYGYVFYVLRRA